MHRLMVPRRWPRVLLLLMAALLQQTIAPGAAHVDVPSATGGLVRDPGLHEPLPSLLQRPLQDPTLDAALARALAACRAEGIGGVFDDPPTAGPPGDAVTAATSTLDDWRYCNGIRFVRHHRQRLRSMHDELSDLEGPDGIVTETIAVETRNADELDLEGFFNDYAWRRRPVILQTTTAPPSSTSIGDIGIPNENIPGFLDACFDAQAVVSSFRPQADPACTGHLVGFRVPLVMVHDYIQRTNVSASETYLPALINLLAVPQRASLGVACPTGFNTLLMPLNSGSIDLGVDIVDNKYRPDRRQLDDDGGPHEVLVNADASTEMADSMPHSLVASAPAAFRARLRDRQLLYVPGSYFARLDLQLLERAVVPRPQVLRFCSIDAANLNIAKEALEIAALVDNEARILLLSLHSPAFDTSMPRRPSISDALWANFVEWPKPTKIVKRSDVIGNAESGAEAPALSRRERLKLWQEDKRWDRQIESLTLPVPRPPAIINSTRSSVTLRWQDLYQSRKHDITIFGYEVRWWREHSDDRDLSLASPDCDEGAINFTHKHLIRSSMPTLLFGDDFDGKDIEGVITGLDADTSYSFSVRIFVGDAMGIASERSKRAKTMPCTVPDGVRGVPTLVHASSATCMRLRWLDPLDSGGSKISAFVFHFEEASNALVQFTPNHRESALHAVNASDTHEPDESNAWRMADVCGLVPRTQYRVQAAAVNTMGVGPWSEWSDVIQISRADMKRLSKLPNPTLHGSRANAAALLAPSASTTMDHSLLTVDLSDIDEEVHVRGGDGESLRLSVWSGHFSPQRFRVSSELVVADPIDASGPLRNAEMVRGRVVVIVRGSVPFVFKIHHAQDAGAVGVILVDAKGRCDRGFDQHCVPGATRSRREGFGRGEQHALWDHVRVPFVLASRVDGERLLAMLK